MPQVIVTAPGSQPPETRTGSRFLRGNRNHSPTTQNAGRTETPYRTIAEKVHRWGIHFDRQSDPLSFIERMRLRGSPDRLGPPFTSLSRIAHWEC
ncbi:hypothetical protein ACLKA6_017632 [Drosophila palustris]